MSLLELERRLAALAFHAPAERGRGWLPHQRPGNYRPALEQDPRAFIPFLAEFRRRRPGGRVLELGIGPFGGSHFAFALCAGRIVSIDRDAQRIARAKRRSDFDPRRDRFVLGDSREPATFDAAQAEAPYDLLFLDAALDYAGLRRDWERYAALVAPGGLVAVVDGRYRVPTFDPGPSTDLFLVELERDWCAPRGLALHRLAGRPGIAWYEQPAGAAAVPGPLTDPPRLVRPLPEPAELEAVEVGQLDGFRLASFRGRIYAVPEDKAPFAPIALFRGDYEILFAARSAARVAAWVRLYARARPALEAAARALAAGRADRAQEIRALALVEDLVEGLREAVSANPAGREAYLHLGILLALRGARAEARAVLRRAAERAPLDPETVQAAAFALHALLGLEGDATALLRAQARRLRCKEIEWICLEEGQTRGLFGRPALLAGLSEVRALTAVAEPAARVFARLGLPIRPAAGEPPPAPAPAALYAEGPDLARVLPQLEAALARGAAALHADLDRVPAPERTALAAQITEAARRRGFHRPPGTDLEPGVLLFVPTGQS